MIVSKFGYKGGPSATKEPILKKINDNLIGLELEFNNTLIQDCDNCECCDCDYCDEEGYTYTNPDVYDAFERLFKKGIIINPSNMHMIQKDHNAVLERDGSVDGEVILQADYQKNIMKKVNQIHEELNSSILNNGRNTSCNIHRNVNYLVDVDSSKYDYQKANEFLAGLLFRISGRDKISYQQWCASIFNPDINIEYVSMLQMAKYVDNMDRIINGKYLLCNCDHNNTVETRIFSNYHNFDPRYIKLFIDFTNLAIDISSYMHGKSYVDEFDNLIDYINEFCNKTHRRRKLLRPYRLDQYIVKKEDIKYVEFNGKWSEIYSEIENVANRSYISYNDQIMNMIRIIRNNNLTLNTTIRTNDRLNFNDIISELNRNYNNELEDL